MDVLTLTLAKSGAKVYTDEAINQFANGFNYQGSVETIEDLPATAEKGDTYNIQTGGTYAWDGTAWYPATMKGDKGDTGEKGETGDTGAAGEVTTAQMNTAISNYHDSTKADATDVPNATSDLTNDSGFITNLVDNLTNYYTKTSTYTKTEVNTLLDAIKNGLFEIVSVLPTASSSTMNKIYLVPSSSSEVQNVKDEFITIDNGDSAETRYTWEQIGSTAVDLSDYYSKSEADALFLTDHQSLSAYRTSVAQDTIDNTKVSSSNISHETWNITLDDNTVVTKEMVKWTQPV